MYYYSLCVVLICSLMVGGSKSQGCPLNKDATPYITFKGRQLSNHSFVDIQEIISGMSELECRTRIELCCEPQLGGYVGQWVLPNGSVVAPQNSPAYSVTPGNQQVNLSISAMPQAVLEGLYRCDILLPNVSVANSVYLGLYYQNQRITIDEVYFSVPDVWRSEFTITCVTSGGPVTCVQWVRDGSPIPSSSSLSTPVDPERGTYDHILAVTETEGAGVYECMVANDKPNNITGLIRLKQAPASPNLFLEQRTPTSILAHWVLPPDLVEGHGFRLSYSGGGASSGSTTISNRYANNHLFTGLRNGTNYTMNIVTTSTDPTVLPSTVTRSNLRPLVPGAPQLQITSATVDSLSLSWTVPAGTVVVSYEINWQFSHTELAIFRTTLSPSAINNHTITGLGSYGDSTLSVSVTAFNAVGNTTSPLLNIAANFASETQDQSCSPNDEKVAIITGAVLGGCVVISISVMVLGISVYCRKRESGEDSSERKVTGNCLLCCCGKPRASAGDSSIEILPNDSYGGTLPLAERVGGAWGKTPPTIINPSTNIFSLPLPLPLPPPPPPPSYPPPPAKPEDETYDYI